MARSADALRGAAERLGCRFPRSFVEAFVKYPLAEVVSWQLWAPNAWQPLHAALSKAHSTFDPDSSQGPFAVVIGQDDSGELVCLRSESADGRELGTALFLCSQETGALHKLAEDITELDEVRGLAADALLVFAEEPPRSERYWQNPALAARDSLCRFCGSGLEGGSSCPVCGRGVNETPDEDEGMQRARSLLERLVSRGAIELSEEGRRVLVEPVAAILDRPGSNDERASWLATRLLDEPEVIDLFADDAEIARLIGELERKR